MKQETISSIVMLAKADPEATPEQVQHIMRACRAKEFHRELLDSETARKILGVSRVTMSKWVRTAKLHPVRVSARIYRYDKNEIESIAYGNA